MPDIPGLNTLTYERFRTLIVERSGLHFPDKRRQDLERGLAQALARSGCANAEAYYQLLAGKPTDGPEWESLIGQVTIGETYFFRDRGQIEALRQHILPDLIAQKRALTRQLRIWSAGCASGEEPYSIAMLLRELLPDLATWSITLLATDINQEALEKARAGRYGDWSFREEGWERMRERYFTHHGKEWQLAQEVRDMVTFAYLNLGEDPYPSMANNTVAFDVILCRNVTIYFAPDRVRHVVDRMYEALAEGGWLVVGHSEPSPVTYTRFEAQSFPGTILYQKTGRPPRFDMSWLASVERTPEAARPVTTPAAPFRLPKAEAVPAAPAPAPAPVRAPVPAAPPPPPASPLADVMTLLAQGRTDEALEQLHRVLDRDPKCAPAYFMVGKMRANAGLWEEARRWFEQALGLDPLLTEAHFLLSLVHSQEGNLEAALAAMKRVVYLDRNTILGHFCLANLYQEAGNRPRARKSLENTAVLLAGVPEDTVIPWSDGMTAGRLRYTVGRQLLELGVSARDLPNGALSGGVKK
jgi:chemotaxis protein methyltransferase CheR